MTAYRFLYRDKARHNGGWMFLPGRAAFNTREGAERLVTEWNQRDRNKWVWRCEESLPGDIDHPDFDENAFRITHPWLYWPRIKEPA